MTEELDAAAITGTSNEAVERATGQSWAKWLAMLDAAGGREMNHKQIVAHLQAHSDVSSWWQQQLAVGYEQSRGLRARHQMADGYQISRSRTVAAPAAAVYHAWADDATRAGWLPDALFTVRKATPPRSLRLTWGDPAGGGATSVEVALTDKGERTVVTVQHNKLPDAAAAERMKAYWAAALGRLAGLW
ncbi:MAG: SRPBCC domain-containing protein [Candidatus Promineofilum sp.]|nr:SRPBCC domain-containing protein [Promineifilum sp.]